MAEFPQTGPAAATGPLLVGAGFGVGAAVGAEVGATEAVGDGWTRRTQRSR